MKSIIVLITILFSYQATAFENAAQSFSDLFDREISRIEETLADRELFKHEYSESNKSGLRNLTFTNFAFRLRASIGFEVPFIAELQVLPEVELFWDIRSEK